MLDFLLKGKNYNFLIVFIGHSFLSPGSIERLQLMPTAVSIPELPLSTTLLPMAVQNEDITESPAISSEKLRSSNINKLNNEKSFLSL